MCICTYPLPHFWHYICGHLRIFICDVLLLFQRPVNLSDLSITIMVAASTVSSQLDSLWLLTCLFVSLFHGLMLPPNHILSILLSHQCTIKKYIDCTVATLKPCTIPNWYQTDTNWAFWQLCCVIFFWPTRVPSFTSRLDTFCSNQPCQAFCGPWESRCSNCGSKIPSSGPFIWDVSMLQHVYVTLQKPCSLLSYYKLLGIHTPGQTNKNQKNGPWSWKPQNPLLRFHINWTRMVRLDNLWWSNPKENIENGDPKNMKIPC